MKELWRPITGYKGYYEASNLGRIRSLDRTETYNHNGVFFTRFRPGTIIALNRFNRIRLCKNSKYKDFPTDKLIASTWLPNPNNYDYIIHKDGNVLNNCISNLKWAPYKYRSDSKIKSNEIKIILSMFREREKTVYCLSRTRIPYGINTILQIPGKPISRKRI